MDTEDPARRPSGASEGEEIGTMILRSAAQLSSAASRAYERVRRKKRATKNHETKKKGVGKGLLPGGSRTTQGRKVGPREAEAEDSLSEGKANLSPIEGGLAKKWWG